MITIYYHEDHNVNTIALVQKNAPNELFIETNTQPSLAYSKDGWLD